jgi:hypothetical protein
LLGKGDFVEMQSGLSQQSLRPGSVHARIKISWLVLYWALEVVLVPCIVLYHGYQVVSSARTIWSGPRSTLVGVLSWVNGVGGLALIVIFLVMAIWLIPPLLAIGRGPALVISDEGLTMFRGKPELVIRGDSITAVRMRSSRIIEVVAPGGITRGWRRYRKPHVWFRVDVFEITGSQLCFELETRFVRNRGPEVLG